MEEGRWQTPVEILGSLVDADFSFIACDDQRRFHSPFSILYPLRFPHGTPSA
jgi:hypothetical protein